MAIVVDSKYVATSHVCRAVVRSGSREELLKEVVRVLVDDGKFSMAFICWHDPATHELVPVAHFGDAEGYLDRVRMFTDQRPEGQSPEGNAFSTAAPYVCNDFLNDPRTLPWREAARASGWRASAAFPIVIGGLPRGVLCAYSLEPGVFGPDRVELLRQVALDVAFGLEHFDGEERRRQAEAALSASEQRLKSAMDAGARMEATLRASAGRLRQAVLVSQIGIFDHDHLADTIYWSPRQRAIYGWSPDEPLKLQAFYELVHPDDRERITAAVSRAHDPAGTGLLEVENRILLPDGSIRWISTRAQTFFDREGGGRPARTVGAVRDITEQKQAGEEQKKLATVVAMSRDFIGIATVEGRVVYVNDAGMTLVGLRSIEEACQKTVFDFIAECDRARVRDEIYRSLLESGYWSGETRFQHFKTGAPIDVDAVGFLIFDDNGAPLYLATVTRDLTERKRVEVEKARLEEQLLQAQESDREQTEVLQTIVDHIPVMITLTGEDRRVKLVNREWERVLGWRLEEIQKQELDVIAECYPDPRDRHTVMNVRAAARGEWGDFKTTTRDGRKIDTSWAVVKLTDGTTLAIGQDITERKQAEDRLNASFNQLRALTARLQSIREEERKRVAREIHDDLGQSLTSIKIDLASLIRALPDQISESAKAESILGLVDQTIQSVRRIATELRPGILDDLGLVAAVEWAAEEFAARSGTRLKLDLPREDLAIDQESATAIFRIFQETLTNVTRHAEATQVEVHLGKEGDSVVLDVRDNGRGMNEEFATAGSLGILGMRERALLLKGKLTIHSAPGLGTTVTVRIPTRASGPGWGE